MIRIDVSVDRSPPPLSSKPISINNKRDPLISGRGKGSPDISKWIRSRWSEGGRVSRLSLGGAGLIRFRGGNGGGARESKERISKFSPSVRAVIYAWKFVKLVSADGIHGRVKQLSKCSGRRLIAAVTRGNFPCNAADFALVLTLPLPPRPIGLARASPLLFVNRVEATVRALLYHTASNCRVKLCTISRSWFNDRWKKYIFVEKFFRIELLNLILAINIFCVCLRFFLDSNPSVLVLRFNWISVRSNREKKKRDEIFFFFFRIGRDEK